MGWADFTPLFRTCWFLMINFRYAKEQWRLGNGGSGTIPPPHLPGVAEGLDEVPISRSRTMPRRGACSIGAQISFGLR